LASTGIASLDDLLGSEGYPDRSTVLIVGPPGIGKEALVYRFMTLGVAQNEFCFYITKRTVQDVIHDSKAFGFDEDLVRISQWMASAGGQIKFNIDDMTSFSYSIKESLKQKGASKARIAIDVLSPILMLNPPEAMYRFLTQLFSEVKKYDAVLLATLEEGMHSAQIFTAMEELFDGVVELKFYEEGMKIVPILRIKKMRGIPPNPAYYNFAYSQNTGLEVRAYVRQ
jgi:KaiC/GvpD/RAD55 family RecA-like ATPase